MNTSRAMTIARNPYTDAASHFRAALKFYAKHDQEHSAIGEMVAGLLALSAQVARIELAVMAAHET